MMNVSMVLAVLAPEGEIGRGNRVAARCVSNASNENVPLSIH